MNTYQLNYLNKKGEMKNITQYLVLIERAEIEISTIYLSFIDNKQEYAFIIKNLKIF